MKNPNNKLIIRNYTELSDIEVLSYVISVVKEGRVSKTGKGPQYCFHTTFKDNIEAIFEDYKSYNRNSAKFIDDNSVDKYREHSPHTLCMMLIGT